MGNPTYQSLYRRYRPQSFGDVLDQDHITGALRNAVRDGRVGHAYLFSGPRGCGKTSTARILAKVLNCANPVDGEPDCTCDNCVAVERGLVVDWLLEQDAASKSKVDDMRDLLDRVPLGTSGRRKVIILDEVHMLSQGAENALLKTLEEPPDHVIFVLATTDPQKVRATIRSRTQHFAFHLVSPDVMAEHMRHVIADAGLSLEDVDAAVDHVVRVGGGSVRDTLSALDQVAALGRVVSDAQPVDVILDAVANRDAGAVMVAVADAMATGRDARGLGEALIGRLRNAFLALMGAADEHLAPAERDSARALGERFGAAGLTRALDVLGEALTELARKPDPRVVLEVALVRMVRPDTDRSLDAILDRLSRLEQAVATGNVAVPEAAAANPGSSGTGSTGGSSSGAQQPAPAPSAKPPGRPEPSSGGGPAPAPGPSASAAAPAAGGAGPAPASAGPSRGSEGSAGPASAARAVLAARQGQSRSGGGPSVPRPQSASPGAEPTDPSASAPDTRPTAAADTGSTAPPPGGGTAQATATAAPTTVATAEPTSPPTTAAAPASTPQAARPSAAKPSASSSSVRPAPTEPEPAPEPSDPPAAAAAAPASAATAGEAGSLPDMATFPKVWSEQLLGELPQTVRSKWRGGRWLEAADGALRFAAPNQWHLKACEEGRLDVEKVLANHFGHRIPVQLVDESVAGPAPGASPAGSGPAPAEPPPDDHDDVPHPAEIAALPDADVTVGGVDLLLREFGGEIVQEERPET